MSPRFSFKLPGDSGRRSVDLPAAEGNAACSLPVSEPPPKLVPATSADLVVAMRRLISVCSDYLGTGPRIGVEPNPEHLLRVVKAALALCDGLPAPVWGDDVESFFLRGLLDELTQQPSNLFVGTRLLNGEEVPVPISEEQWRECLSVLEAAILRGDVGVGGKRQTAHYTGSARPGHLYIPAELGAGGDTPTRQTTPDQLAAIKRWTRECLGLTDEDVVFVHELNCRDPGCPMVETVVAVIAEKCIMRWKFERPGFAVTQAMLKMALAQPPLT